MFTKCLRRSFHQSVYRARHGHGSDARASIDEEQFQVQKIKIKQFLRMPTTIVTRWLDYFSIFDHLQQWKIAQ